MLQNPAPVEIVDEAFAAAFSKALPIASGNDAKKGVRDVYFDRQWHESTIYDGHALGPQSEVVGPCIVEFEHACAVIPPYGVGTVDDYGNMIIELNKVAKKGEAI